jgi:outer membrane protein OmpA-like peptidoglycan-associated protein
LDLSKIEKEVTKRQNIYVKRKPSLVLEGFLREEKTKEKISGEIVFVRIKDGVTIDSFKVTPKRGYKVTLEEGYKYEIEARSKGHLSDYISVDLTNLKRYKEEKRDLHLKKLEKMRFEIENIYFETAKAKLLPKSYEELNKLVKILNDAPNIKVQISGHTDTKGSASYNQELSQRRAQSVMDYLIKNGIPYTQIVAKGYGESKPVTTNSTEEGRAKNRRVEFEILEVN